MCKRRGYEMNIKHFMAVIVTLVIILAGCSNSGSNDSGNKSSDSNKKIMTKSKNYKFRLQRA